MWSILGLVKANGNPKQAATSRLITWFRSRPDVARPFAVALDRLLMSPEALAVDEAAGRTEVDSARLRFLWRTGLHAEVSRAGATARDRRCWSAPDRIRLGASRIAVGEPEDGCADIAGAVREQPSPRNRIRAAEALARIDLGEARDILDGVRDNIGLVDVSLAVAAGDVDYVDDRMVEPGALRAAEYYLLRANAHTLRGEVDAAVAAYNRYLGRYGLAPVVRPQVSRPLSTTNVAPQYRPVPLSGPRVTVIMPVRNAPQLDAAIRSVTEQSWQDLEILVIDDASDDGTADVARSWQSREPRLRVVRLNSNHGTYVARNVGLAKAEGDYVTFHDGDDWSHPEKIARQVRAIHGSPLRVASVSWWTRIDEGGMFRDRQVSPLCRLNWSSFLFRRTPLLDLVGGFEPVRVGGDTEFVRRVRTTFGPQAIAWQRLPLSLGGFRPDSLTNNPRTGYGSRGFCLDRQRYWEAWNRRHIAAMTTGVIPAVPLELPTSLQLRWL